MELQSNPHSSLLSPPAFRPQHSAWIFHTVAISSTSNLGCPFSLLQDLSRFRHFSWINELVKGSLSFSFYAAPALTCSFNAFRPFSIERPGCPEVYSWLPSGHDTVKGLPKEKPRTSGKLRGPCYRLLHWPQSHFLTRTASPCVSSEAG